MESVQIREELHQFVDAGDDKLLKLLYAVAKEYSSDDSYEFNADELAEFETRRQSRLRGESAVYDWKDAKAMITGSK